ncbi:nitrogenase component 1 [Desulfolutivibrio sulfoxidireducens]|uniref:nitrogenase component 1 n=1 Tax=Desulfolutivibrio sulfoxidireducens TaxID=2773299 RepID=UPI00159D8C43|nr:nitrogenase component 1 [Desulfolutivibrio sulfoxidireducens]QLA17037.1 nitrogenase [Desulfolutivibrio sulfoxidireducens]
MKDAPFVSTTNACKLCTPLGAALAFRGIEGAIPFLHGSQGCATYMRRYIISHFREPMDIASSALGEKQAVFGGGPNLKKGILNVMEKYGATVIGVATTCLTETIGDDVPRLVYEFKKEFADLPLPEIVTVSTPSYSGTHMDGWHAAMAATVDQLADPEPVRHGGVNVLPGFVSPEDIRHVKDIFEDFGLAATILPDISETMDGPALLDYEKIPKGGTPVSGIKAMSGARATVEFGRLLGLAESAGHVLQRRFGVPRVSLGLPMGIRETDALFAALEDISGRPTPARYARERGRYVDSLVDGHKYVSGKRAVVYGEEDLVIGLTAFLAEIGVHPVLVATGGKDKGFKAAVAAACADMVPELPAIREGVDFFDIAAEAGELAPDLMVGHSKGYRYAKQWNAPLVRVGFPLHDRFGGQRVRHLSYGGAQALFDRVVNAVLARQQDACPVGYGYL